MYKHMTLEVFERFNRAAEAFADIGNGGKWHSQIVVDFYNRYLDSFVHDCKKLPARFTIVYAKGDKYGNYRLDYIYAINTVMVELRKVRLTEKSIVFDNGYVLPFSKIKFFVW